MKKYENFCSALHNLKSVYECEEPYDIVTLTGLVGLYEICFEQAWKLMKALLEEYGFEGSATGSPKTVLKTAFKAGMIHDEKLWLEALQERNNVVHSYNENIALGIVNLTKEAFCEMFDKLKEELEANWLN